MNAGKTIALEKKVLLGNYARPDDFVPVRGKGSYIWDAAGKKYLDFVSGIAVNALGHAHPGLLKAVSGQAKKFMHVSNLYHTGLDAGVAAGLVKLAKTDRAFFCNSGTEANEAAIKFARRFAARKHGQERFEIIVFSNAFHGRTYGALSATPQPKYQADFGPMLPGFTVVPYNNAAALTQAVSGKTAAILVEFLQGEGGGEAATPEFITSIEKARKEFKALLINDEIQSGLGRTGRFLCQEWHGVRADIITLAKPLGGGLPLGAVLMTEAIASEIGPGDHGTTFGGNPVALAAAAVILKAVTGKGFLKSVERKGAWLRKVIVSLNHPRVGAVRGKGLWTAVEIKEDANGFMNSLRKNGLLSVRAGANFVRLLPPLNVSDAELKQAVAIFKKTLG